VIDPNRPSGPGGSIAKRTALAVTLGVVAATVLMLWFLFLQSDGIALRSDDWLSNTGRDDVTPGDAWFNAARTALTALGALGIGGAAYLGYRRQSSKEAERVDALQRDKQAIDRDLQVIERALHDRTTDAAAQLGHDNASIRIAGTYALAAIADDWLRLTPQRGDQAQAVINVLTAYLRSDTTLGQLPHDSPTEERDVRDRDRSREQDVRNAVTAVIAEHLRSPSTAWVGRRIDLRNAQLGGADLSDANLTGADLSHTDLGSANLRRARLNDARLNNTNLSYASLEGIELKDAHLHRANLDRARLYDADLTKATLTEASLRGASLAGARVKGAFMNGANLSGANLDGADLGGAWMNRVNMTDVRGVHRSQFTSEQLESMAVAPSFPDDRQDLEGTS
jgi:hypothetical protein